MMTLVLKAAAICVMLLAISGIPAYAATTYAYDALGRVTSVTYDNGTVVTYTYDAAGNRVSVVTTCSATGC